MSNWVLLLPGTAATLVTATPPAGPLKAITSDGPNDPGSTGSLNVTRTCVAAAPLFGAAATTRGAVASGTTPTAAARLTRPPLTTLPASDGSRSAVASNWVMTCATVQFGWTSRIRATTPATCGVAIEVPLSVP